MKDKVKLDSMPVAGHPKRLTPGFQRVVILFTLYLLFALPQLCWGPTQGVWNTCDIRYTYSTNGREVGNNANRSDNSVWFTKMKTRFMFKDWKSVSKFAGFHSQNYRFHVVPPYGFLIFFSKNYFCGKSKIGCSMSKNKNLKHFITDLKK